MKRLLGYTIASALVLVTSAALAKPPVPISECGLTITEPGKYKLVNDLVGCEGHGVRIAGSDITLNMKGHSISCNTKGGTKRLGGVVVWAPDWSLLSNVTVKNGHVSDCSDGFLLVATEDAQVKNVSSTRNLASKGESGTGITVWYSTNARVTKSHAYENEMQGIGVSGSTGTVIKHNTATSNYVGIGTTAADDTKIACNEVYSNGTGVLLGPWSTGGRVKGNLAKWNWFDGISAWGWAYEEGPWDEIASGNIFKHNLAEENGFDHVELVYNVDTGMFFPHPDGVCRNRWIKNQYGLGWGPDGCISPPVKLDDDDVCAIDDDDEEDDDD